MEGAMINITKFAAVVLVFTLGISSVAFGLAAHRPGGVGDPPPLARLPLEAPLLAQAQPRQP
jgi:hypothetical protein